jgi:hypothetical protein
MKLHIGRMPVHEFVLLIALDPLGAVIIRRRWPYLKFLGMDDYYPGPPP